MYRKLSINTTGFEGLLLYPVIFRGSLQGRITTQGDPYSHYREWVFSVKRCHCQLACKIHPAAQSDIGEQQWVTGFHEELVCEVLQDG